MPYQDLVSDRRATPQAEQADARQVENNAGGFTFTLSSRDQLLRFLILGSDRGTFYASAKALTRECAAVVDACFALEPDGTCVTIGSVSESRRAPSNDAAILATAMAIACPAVTGEQACRLVLRVCRTGTHLFQLCSYIKKFRGWGRKARRAVACWYESKASDDLAYQVAKYRQRDGWTHRDVLRVSHPSRFNREERKVVDWACGRAEGATGLLAAVAQAAEPGADVAALVRSTNGLSWEMLPSESLRVLEVWRALVETKNLPTMALLRNLGRMGALGLLKPLDSFSVLVAERIVTETSEGRARVHPIDVLKALRVYAKGHSDKGSLSWVPVPLVVEALEAAFYSSFASVESSGKRTLLAIDVSGSMGCTACGGASMLTCAEGAAVMAMVTYRAEPATYAHGFAHDFRDLGITPGDRLDAVLAKTSINNFGGTDCALPMVHALEQGLEVDTFVVYTDNETWCGGIHPHQALREYRDETGINAKLVVVGMAATEFTIAAPGDAGMLDCVGFDAATPQAIAAFARD